ncbi:MAG TPA: ESX secretion-associated protein EspG [Jatrophihabitans sp.]|nr:ESX secretion-associated protein EspG [Jatrophihabitans sp.]
MMSLAWRLSAAQWDVLTEVLGLEGYPAPIQVCSSGRTRLEHARVRADVCVELSQLGLLHAGRVDADLEAALHLLHWPSTWVDSVWLADAAADQPVRVVAARGGAAGVCALQHPDQPGATLLEVIAAAGLGAAVVSRLPSHPPGRSSAVTVPRQPGTALQSLQHRGAQSSGRLLVAASPAQTSADRDLAAAAAILNKPHARAGQIAANVREPSGRVRRRTYCAGATTLMAATT